MPSNLPWRELLAIILAPLIILTLAYGLVCLPQVFWKALFFIALACATYASVLGIFGLLIAPPAKTWDHKEFI